MIDKQTNTRWDRFARPKNGVQLHRRALVFRHDMNETAAGKIVRNVPKRLPRYAFSRNRPLVQNGTVSAGKLASYAYFKLAAITPEPPHVIQVMPACETETIMLEQIIRRMWRAAASQIRRRRTQDAGGDRDLTCDHHRIIGKAKPEDEIAVICLVFQARIGEHKMRLQSRMLGSEQGQNGCEVPAAEIARRADLQQSSGSAPPRSNFGFRVAYVLENGTASFIEQQALIGQAKAARTAVCKPDAQL